MYRQTTDFTEIECWNEVGTSTQYWLHEDELKTLIERIQVLAENRAETNRNSKLQYAEHSNLPRTQHSNLHNPQHSDLHNPQHSKLNYPAR